jgi:hypothetical protein
MLARLWKSTMLLAGVEMLRPSSLKKSSDVRSSGAGLGPFTNR